MAKQRQLFSTHDASPRSFKSREWDSMSRWSEYISLEELSSSTPMNGRSLGSDAPPNSGTVPKALHMEWVDKLAMDTLTVNAQDYFQKLEPWVMLLLDLMAFREQALRIPRKMMLQLYNMLHTILKGGRDCELYHRLVQFVDSYDPPVKGLQEDLNFVSPRIGEVLEAVGPIIFLSTDTKKMRNEGFLSPFHPRYPDILTNSAHPMRAQDLANVTSYREWVLFGYLVCPDELLRVTCIDIAMVVLKEHLVLTLFRDECYVLPRILESKKLAKSGRAKQKEADLEYNVAKQVEKMIRLVLLDKTMTSLNSIHMVVEGFEDQGLLNSGFFGLHVINLCDGQMVFSALSLAQSEDAADPTIGFLLDGKDKLCHLVRKYMAAIKGYALSYLSSSAGRIRFLLGTPGMVALDIDSTLKNLFQQDLRKYWLSILMIVTSSRSSINIRHLEKATVSTGKEGLLSEGNAAYNWSRCVDELESQLARHGSLMKLYFYHHHLTAVFRNTMFGPEGRPQHCCAWLGVASSFPECASAIVPDELNKVGRDSILYVESLIESIMGGLEGLINILDSEGGFGSLEMQLVPEQAAFCLNNVLKGSTASFKSPKGWSMQKPGYESYPENTSSVKMHDDAHEGDSLRLKTSDKQQRNTRSSGPLEYSSSRKVKFAEGSSSGGQGPSPLLRFAVSRSGPLSYKFHLHENHQIKIACMVRTLVMMMNLKRRGYTEGESRVGVGESGHEGVVRGLEVEVELAGLLLGELVGGAHLSEAREPITNLDAALEVRWEKTEEGVHLVDGHHVELDGVHGRDEVLHAFSDGGGRGGRGRGCSGAVLDGCGDTGNKEAVEGSRGVEAVDLGEAIEGGDGAVEGGMEASYSAEETRSRTYAFSNLSVVLTMAKRSAKLSYISRSRLSRHSLTSSISDRSISLTLSRSLPNLFLLHDRCNWIDESRSRDGIDWGWRRRVEKRVNETGRDPLQLRF
ncbi:Membrane-associated apoptosis protein [Musa troglodytarum]|uniref:Membrane-associated apoptosis protein n=1 Tax=Musa troglodytarum TaxID=320322 RepID=A0A9E7IB78_9LILI|nr:Membrane-associated apoptosis protein [Musa troglodytarum]